MFSLLFLSFFWYFCFVKVYRWRFIMAKLYNTKDLNQDQMDAEKARANFWDPFVLIAFLGAIGSFSAMFFLPFDKNSYDNSMKYLMFSGICFAAFLFFAIMGARGKSTTNKSIHRSNGHDAFVEKIGKLFSDDYHAVFSVFLQKEKENMQKFDCLLVGPTGVFIIDFSTATGTIEAKKDVSVWPHRKVGSGGTPYDGNPISNPTKRLNYQSTILRTLLRQQRLDLWVEGYFIFIECTRLITDAPNIYSDYSKLKEQIVNRKTILNKQQISQILNLVVEE